MCVYCNQGLGQCHISIHRALPLNSGRIRHLYFYKFYGCGGCKILLAFNILEFVYLLAICLSLLIAGILGSFPFHFGFCLLGSAWAECVWTVTVPVRCPKPCGTGDPTDPAVLPCSPVFSWGSSAYLLFLLRSFHPAFVWTFSSICALTHFNIVTISNLLLVTYLGSRQETSKNLKPKIGRRRENKIMTFKLFWLKPSLAVQLQVLGAPLGEAPLAMATKWTSVSSSQSQCSAPAG